MQDAPKEERRKTTQTKYGLCFVLGGGEGGRRKERVCTAKLTNQTFVSVVFMIHSIEYGYYRNCIVIIRIRGACGSTDAHSTELRGYSRLVQNGVIIRPHAGLVLSCLPTGKPLSSRACRKAWPKAIAIIIQASIKARRVMKVQ